MARLVLHIGAHKTGTSFLQKLMFYNRDALDRAGIFYPHLGPNSAHHILCEPWIDHPDIPTSFFAPPMPTGWRAVPLQLKRQSTRAASWVARKIGRWDDFDASRRGRWADDMWRRLESSYARRPGTLFLSAEPFSRGDPQSVDFADLAARTRAFEDVRIVYVARRQPELIQSIWLQLSKTAAPPDFAQFLRGAIRNHKVSGVWLDHGRVLDMVERGFAPDRITVWDYDVIRKGPGGIAGAFLAMLGGAVAPGDLDPLPDEDANHSPDALATWIACRIAAPDRPDAALDAAVADALSSLPPGARTSAFTRREYTEVLQAFAPLNAQLTARVSATQPGFRFDAGAGAPASMVYRDTLAIPAWLRLARAVRAD